MAVITEYRKNCGLPHEFIRHIFHFTQRFVLSCIPHILIHETAVDKSALDDSNLTYGTARTYRSTLCPFGALVVGDYITGHRLGICHRLPPRRIVAILNEVPGGHVYLREYGHKPRFVPGRPRACIRYFSQHTIEKDVPAK